MEICSSPTTVENAEGLDRGVDGSRGNAVLGGRNVQHIARVGDHDEAVAGAERGGQVVGHCHVAVTADDERLTRFETFQRPRSAHAASVGCGAVTTTTTADEDRLYFRQLLSGRDFAVDDPLAAQMVNFVYAVGDRSTGECVLVDPAYAVAELLATVAADGMHVTGVIASHYHPDHIGGSMVGHTIEGVAALLEQVDVPVHVQAAEAPWVSRTIGVSPDELTTHEPGRRRARRRHRRRAAAHSWAHAGEPVPPRRRAASCPVTRLFLDGCGRTDLPGGDAGGDVRQLATPRRPARRHGRVPRPPLRVALVRHDVVDPRPEPRVQAGVEGAMDDDVRPVTP